MLNFIGNMPGIVAVTTGDETQRHITGGALDGCLCTALHAFQPTSGAVPSDMDWPVMCSMWSKRWYGTGCGGRPNLCQLLSEGLSEGLLAHGYLSFASCKVFLEEKGIHYRDVHEMIEKRLVPLHGLVEDFVVPYQGVREVHSTHAPGWTGKQNIEKKYTKT